MNFSRQSETRTEMPKQLSRLVLTCLVLLLTLLAAAPAGATEEFANATGLQCRACHLDPLGGGTLTDVGRGYALSLASPKAGTMTAAAGFSRIFRLVCGYIHILTGFLWFGTILYVHLVLKPAYASQGLPSGEVRVGLLSMAVMAVTGAVLTWYKVPSLHLLLTSTFGRLLLAKMIIFSFMVVSALFVVLFLGPRLRKKTPASLPASGELSVEQLGAFDGSDGRPAYIAFQGKIFDVSGSRLWQGGSHMKRHQAGIDLTEVLSQAPHGEDKIAAMPEVGRLSDRKSASPHELHKRVFFAMAYMNLGCVFLVCLILALWHWY